ncbi:MAG: stage II sporulation protein P, partial [Clostridia bacterium]|nr:stage II sporulation protein P [Clostridia bacterium]
GKNAAQVMLVMGSQTGGITNYPNWKENLSLALKYQQTLEVMYPGLARAVTLNSGKYNQNLSKGSILLEVGTEANTLDEAKRGAAYAGDALVSLLNTLK